MIFIYFAFLIISILKVLYFTYIFQIKEYRYDRIMSFFKETGFWKELYGIGIKRPALKNPRNIMIVTSALLPLIILFLFLTEQPTWFGLLNFFLAPITALVLVTILTALSSIPVYFYRQFLIFKAIFKVRRSQAVFIGITGSYGKSSVKEFLYHILSQKYTVAKTEKNMNTDVGISLSILKNLNNKTDYFIAEVGAYRKGEIKEAMSICRPKYGILTALGNQHIDLFGGKENLVQAKLELLRALPQEGRGYVNLDTLEDKKVVEKIAVPIEYFGFTDKADITAQNIHIADNKTRATIFYQNKTFEITTHLLGEHSIHNLLPCIALALEIGMSRGEIVKAIASLEQLEAKLSTHTGINDSVVLNDSNNSSVEGFITALKTLKKFPKQDTIIISRGIIELGSEKKKSYERIIKELEKTSIRFFTTDILFKELDKKEQVTMFRNEDSLLKGLLPQLTGKTMLLIEGKFPTAIIDQLIQK